MIPPTASADTQMAILILEDNSDRRHAMQVAIADRFAQYPTYFFATAGEFIDYLRRTDEMPLAISLDHDLDLIPIAEGRLIDPGSGRDVADFLATMKPICPVVIHSSNAIAVSGMTTVLEDSGWDVHRVLPDADTAWVGTGWLREMRNAIVAAVSLEHATVMP